MLSPTFPQQLFCMYRKSKQTLSARTVEGQLKNSLLSYYGLCPYVHKESLYLGLFTMKNSELSELTYNNNNNNNIIIIIIMV
jgi:hypothetical protein